MTSSNNRSVAEVLKLVSVLRDEDGEPIYRPSSGMCQALNKAYHLGVISYSELSRVNDEVNELIWMLQTDHYSDNMFLLSYKNPDKCREVYWNWSKRHDLILSR